MDLRQLKRKLMFHNMPLHLWGQNNGKTVEDFLEEINAGESRLIESEGRLLRRVECATMDIFHQGAAGRLHLKETHQIVRGKRRVRKRNWSLYEKKLPGEDPIACAYRGLLEELEIEERLELRPSQLHYDESPSLSFPGLWTSYVFHPFDVNLPERWYKPEGYVDTSESPKEETYFTWVTKA